MNAVPLSYTSCHNPVRFTRVSDRSNSYDPRQPSWPVPEYDPEVHPLAQPPLDYTCPEAALCMAHTPYSDMYSLASLAYSVFTNGGTVYNCAADWYAYKKAMNEVRGRLVTCQHICEIGLLGSGYFLCCKL